MKVLIVEQEATLHQSLTIFMERCKNYQVASAHCKNDALLLLQVNTFDLVLCADALPDGDGLEMLNRVKSCNPDIVSVLMTVKDDQALAQKALQSGISGYLVKPFDLKQLEALIGVGGP